MSRILVVACITWLEMLRRKDVYVLFTLLAVLLATLVSLNMFGLAGLVVYIKDIGFLLTWLYGIILAISISARALPQEEQRGTIFSLLAKPLTRLELIVGKWLGAWVVTLVSLALFYGLIVAVVVGRGGRFAVWPLVQGYLLHCGAVGILSAVAFLFSTHMNPDASATLSYVVAAAAFLIVPRVPAFLVRVSGFSADALLLLYHVLPHFEVLDMRNRLIYDQGAVSLRVLALALGYAAAYTATLLLATWLAYRRKRFGRSSGG